MPGHLAPGAFMKGTKTFVKPVQAEKRVNGVKTAWECPSCNTDAVFCKGKIVPPYFRHPPESNCTFFNPTGMSAQHLGAQNLLKNLLETDRTLTITRRCTRCRKDDTVFELGTRPAKSSARTEHSFYIDGNRYSADVALLEDNQIRCIFEVCWTHETNRPPHEHPWVELRAGDILELGAEGPVTLDCILPSHKCAPCLIEYERLETERKEVEAREKKQQEELAAKRKCEAIKNQERWIAEQQIRDARRIAEQRIWEAQKKMEDSERKKQREKERLIADMTLLQRSCYLGEKHVVEYLLDECYEVVCDRSIELAQKYPEILELLKAYRPAQP